MPYGCEERGVWGMSIEFYHDTETENKLLRRVTKWIVDLTVAFALALFLVPWIAFILGLVGLITGIVSLVQHRAGHGAAVAGVVTSAIGLVIAFIVVVLFIVAIVMAV